MAGRAAYASFLPSIKCSNCGDEIEISMMGDHVCGNHVKESEPEAQHTNHDRFLLPATQYSPRNESRPVTQTEDLLSAQSFTIHNANEKELPALELPDDIPPSTSPEILTPASDPALSPRPLSDERQDGGVSSLPVPPRSHTVPPADSGKLRPSNAPAALNLKPFDPREDKDNFYAPLSPRVASGASVLRRMNTMTAGPFNAKPKRFASKKEVKPPTAEKPQPSSRGPAPPRPPRPETSDSLLDVLQTSGEHGPTMFRRVESSQPHAPAASISEPPKSRDSTNSQQNQHDESHHHATHQSESSNASRDISDGSNESVRSSAPTSYTSNSPQRKSSTDELQDLAPAPARTMTAGPSELDGPILSRSVYVPKPRASQLPTVNNTNTPDTSNTSNTSQRESETGRSSIASSAANFSRPRAPEPLRPTLSVDTPVIGAMESPADPAIQSGQFQRRPAFLDTPPDSATFSPGSRSPRSPDERGDRSQRLATRSRTGQRMAPKGDCRGCGAAILGKSIRAADGRLSGRYHRECFACKTCLEPFQTMDFYVLNDQPYCAQHYHVHNGSLCKTCDKGIEGKYIETMPEKTKHHMECFTCYDCRRPLARDYFEINGRFYCEQDALQVHRKNNLLSPGKRFPERRATKLMMM